MEALLPTGMPLGIEEDSVWNQETVQLNPGDVLVLYTDGIPDALNLNEESFDNARLLAALDGCGPNPAAVLNHIQTQLAQFIGEADQFDDITLIAVKRDAQSILGKQS